jgi:hypothetical protein
VLLRVVKKTLSGLVIVTERPATSSSTESLTSATVFGRAGYGRTHAR